MVDYIWSGIVGIWYYLVYVVGWWEVFGTLQGMLYAVTGTCNTVTSG